MSGMFTIWLLSLQTCICFVCFSCSLVQKLLEGCVLEPDEQSLLYKLWLFMLVTRVHGVSSGGVVSPGLAAHSVCRHLVLSSVCPLCHLSFVRLGCPWMYRHRLILGLAHTVTIAFVFCCSLIVSDFCIPGFSVSVKVERSRSFCPPCMRYLGIWLCHALDTPDGWKRENDLLLSWLGFYGRSW